MLVSKDFVQIYKQKHQFQGSAGGGGGGYEIKQ